MTFSMPASRSDPNPARGSPNGRNRSPWWGSACTALAGAAAWGLGAPLTLKRCPGRALGLGLHAQPPRHPAPTETSAAAADATPEPKGLGLIITAASIQPFSGAELVAK